MYPSREGQSQDDSCVRAFRPRTLFKNQGKQGLLSASKQYENCFSEPEHTRHQPRYYNEQERKRQYRIALNFFNKKPERGVQLLTAWRFVDDSAESLANLLFGRRGLSKQMIGEYIATLHSTFHSCVLKYFIGQIDVRGMEVDVALRKAMQYFFLPKEAEKIDKIIQEFAQHYAKCNPKRTKQFRGGWDTIHMIAFAVIMLNTDLHSPNLKVSTDFFLKGQCMNVASDSSCQRRLKATCLAGIYERVRAEEIRPGDDHVAQVARVDAAIVARDKPRLTETQRRLVCYCRLQQVMDPSRKQSVGSHERDVFLFNDMLVVGRRTSSHTSYTVKHWMPLLGASVLEFKRGAYEFGLSITPPAPDNQPIYFNARNYDDRWSAGKNRHAHFVQRPIAPVANYEQVPRMDYPSEPAYDAVKPADSINQGFPADLINRMEIATS
ncbi:unnamed protein product [Heligmosomoides polygyrus]|uniref:SEC7 domain-containing protein n=1 Tax=Heligmosomoides polygyrus TaxID=6339 RepID=A0A3P8BAQ1_HELPZ|nr:unnamed protein product [Heligmosomoides polygyrus]